MAIIRFSSQFGKTNIDDMYELLVRKHVSSTKIVYKDSVGNAVVFSGEKIKTAGDQVSTGTINSVTFSEGGATVLKLMGGTFEAAALLDGHKTLNKLDDLMTALTANKDRIVGSSSGEVIIAGNNSGNDIIKARGGDDLIRGSAGNNVIDGGSGYDVLTYDPSTTSIDSKVKGIVVDVAKGIVRNSYHGLDKVKGIEEVRGTGLKDVMRGGSGDDKFCGLKGADLLVGRRGLDLADYSRDADFGGGRGIVANLKSGKIKDGFGSIDRVIKIENVRGTQFNDIFRGDDGDNSFRGLNGVDRFNGGAGTDSINFREMGKNDGSHGVIVDLRLSSKQIIDDGYGNTETATSIESLHGTSHGDQFTLSATGDSYAFGFGGNDRLTAGGGHNWLGGGDGADTFVFLSATDSAAGSDLADTIGDFSAAQGDKIDLSAMTGLVFQGAGNHRVGLSTILAYAQGGDTILSADVNADGVSDLRLKLTGSVHLGTGDFIL